MNVGNENLNEPITFAGVVEIQVHMSECKKPYSCMIIDTNVTTSINQL